MSLAAKIIGGLSNSGVSFQKDGKNISNHDAIEILKGVVCEFLLSCSQGGLQNKKYFCDKCAENIQGG